MLAASELEPVASRLSEELVLGEPFSDPAVAHFGLENRVFALDDTFLEVVSPVKDGTAAGRRLERRGGDCGYMVMFEVENLESARERAARRQAREVFEVALDDIAEVHLHPADMRGAIVAVSQPRPRGSWRWGGPGWEERSRPARLEGVRIDVGDPAGVAAMWSDVLGAEVDQVGVRFAPDQAEAGLVEIVVAVPGRAPGEMVEIGGVRFVFADYPTGEDHAGGG